MLKTRRVPPDGGYGWVIVFANALSSFIATPLMHCFGLIFSQTFVELGLTATESSLIINLNAAFGMMTGLINGVLLKWYGFRKVALLASLLLASGVILTSFSRTFTHFVISYGLVTSLGIGLCQSAYSLAVYVYFLERRSYAIGLSETIAGFGPILIPQVISVLLGIYSPKGVTLIFGGICAHVFVAAVLLQPVAWHMKKIQKNYAELLKIDQKEQEKAEKLEQKNVCLEGQEEKKALIKINQRGSLHKEAIKNIEHNTTNKEKKKREEADEGEEQNIAIASNKKEQAKTVSSIPPKNSKISTILKSIGKTLDLDLLQDPVFVNIMLGLALAIFAEVNFTILIPFMLHDYGLDAGQIATFLSTLGGADIIFRFLAPHIGNYFTTPPRWMYAYSLFLLMMTRFTFLLSRDFYVLIVIAVGLGVAKGVRKVYMTLVIPDYVPMDKLATAGGMEMMANGFCIMIGGPALGLVRDITGNYTWCVVIMNCVTFTTITMWVMELIIFRLKKRKVEAKVRVGV